MVKFHLYGLQRSGTNILECYIKDNFGIQVNTDQKHIQFSQIKREINSVEDFDKFSGNDKKYILIFKNIYSWLLSIESWAKQRKWEKTNKMEFIDIYIQQLKKWNQIKNERVLIIFYEDFLKNYSNKNSQLIKNMENFLGKKSGNARLRKSVPCTGRWGHNEQYYIRKKYMQRFKPHELKIIQQKLKQLK